MISASFYPSFPIFRWTQPLFFFILNENICLLHIFCRIFLTVQLHVTKLQSPTEPLSCTKEDESVFPALSVREVDLTPALFFFCCLLCMIRSARAVARPLTKPFLCCINLRCHFCFVFFSFFSSPHFCRGNFTVPKLSESNMGFGVLGVFLGLLLEVSTHGPHAVPRTSWRHQGKTGLWMALQQSLAWIKKVKRLNTFAKV